MTTKGWSPRGPGIIADWKVGAGEHSPELIVNKCQYCNKDLFLARTMMPGTLGVVLNEGKSRRRRMPTNTLGTIVVRNSKAY